MAISYKPLWKTLIELDMSRRALRESTGISFATLAKMNRGGSVSVSVLDRICTELKCPIEDVVRIIPSDEHTEKEGLE